MCFRPSDALIGSKLELPLVDVNKGEPVSTRALCCVDPRDFRCVLEGVSGTRALSFDWRSELRRLAGLELLSVHVT